MRELGELRNEIRVEFRSIRQEMRQNAGTQKDIEQDFPLFRAFEKVSSVEELNQNEEAFNSRSEESVDFQRKLVRHIMILMKLISNNSWCSPGCKSFTFPKQQTQL